MTYSIMTHLTYMYTGNGLVPGMLVHGGSLDVIPVSFQNAHSVYAYWCMSPHVKEIEREEFFVKVCVVACGGMPI